MGRARRTQEVTEKPVKISKFNLLKGTLNELNLKIATLQELEADRADIDELVRERTKIQWAIADEISKNS